METKGSTIVVLKKLIQKTKPDQEQALVQSLSPPARIIYESAMASGWVPMEKESEIILAGARLFFPQNPEKLYDMSKLIAKHSFQGLYKAFLRIPSLPFVLKALAVLWRTFYKKGDASHQSLGPGQGVIRVRNFPELTPEQREEVRGFIAGILELLQVKNPRVEVDVSVPDAWGWRYYTA
ncbi:hypothetical protein JW933_10580 [candidate division FCPU426 bacterium]|nr:hypothetical protein [candidate division FCPU426 bacterium]